MPDNSVIAGSPDQPLGIDVSGNLVGELPQGDFERNQPVAEAQRAAREEARNRPSSGKEPAAPVNAPVNNTPQRSYYEMLGLEPGATPEKIRKQYEAMLQQVQVDATGAMSPDDAVRMIEAERATNVLTHPDMRVIYDNSLLQDGTPEEARNAVDGYEKRREAILREQDVDRRTQMVLEEQKYLNNIKEVAERSSVDLEPGIPQEIGLGDKNLKPSEKYLSTDKYAFYESGKDIYALNKETGALHYASTNILGNKIHIERKVAQIELSPQSVVKETPTTTPTPDNKTLSEAPDGNVQNTSDGIAKNAGAAEGRVNTPTADGPAGNVGKSSAVGKVGSAVLDHGATGLAVIKAGAEISEGIREGDAGKVLHGAGQATVAVATDVAMTKVTNNAGKIVEGTAKLAERVAENPGFWAKAASKFGSAANWVGSGLKKVPVVGAVVTGGVTLYRAGSAAVNGEWGLAGAELAAGAVETAGGLIPVPGLSIIAMEAGRQAVVEAIDYKTGIRAQDSASVSLIKEGYAFFKGSDDKPAAIAAPALVEVIESTPTSTMGAAQKGIDEVTEARKVEAQVLEQKRIEAEEQKRKAAELANSAPKPVPAAAAQAELARNDPFSQWRNVPIIGELIGFMEMISQVLNAFQQQTQPAATSPAPTARAATTASGTPPGGATPEHNSDLTAAMADPQVAMTARELASSLGNSSNQYRSPIPVQENQKSGSRGRS